MPSNIKYLLVPTIGIFLLFGCSKNEFKKITIKAFSNSINDSSSIYITGNTEQFGDWSAAKVKLIKDSLNTWSKSFYFIKGEELEYEFTRGSFSSEAFGPKGILYPFNQDVTVNNDTTITTFINGWKDKTGGLVFLSTNDLGIEGDITITSGWKYHPGDSAAWANPNYNDANWEVTNTLLNPEEHPLSGWDGIGWFRIKIKMDSSLIQNSFMFNLRQVGASEIYLDGKLINKFGKVSNSKEDEIPFIQRIPQPLIFSNNTTHLIAVRYSNHSTKYFNDIGFYAGFEFKLGFTEDRIKEHLTAVENSLFNQLIYAVIPFTLAILHLIIFAFYPRYKENLYYALCMIGFAGIVFSVNRGVFTTDVFQIINLHKLGFVFETLAIVFALLTTYYLVYGKTPKHGWLFIGFGFGFVLWVLRISLRVSLIQDIFLLLVILEMLRCILFVKRKTKNSLLLLSGFLILLVSIIYQLLIEYGFIHPVFGFTKGYVLGALVLSFTMSVRLSINFANANKKMEEQLIQVKELSEQALENERKAKDQEIERRLLEADNKRKTVELEEARKLQLSMLPKEIPQSQNWDIDVFMRTATEVGGDYYDFHTDDNGTLTIAVGDATGHGVNAGIMVAVTKSLFKELAGNENIVETFNKYNSFIKSMNLGNLYMAMTIAKVKDGKMTVSSAGLPPVLIYRSETKLVEEVILTGLPLGGSLNYPYQQVEIELGINDIVLFMTDGLPEMFNKADEIFGYENTKQEFEKTGKNKTKPPSGKEVINNLLSTAETWANGRLQEDDITFVVLKNLFAKSTRS
jgi:serine phosphatase RsbU (regulator of sigma subunit)